MRNRVGAPRLSLAQTSHLARLLYALILQSGIPIVLNEGGRRSVLGIKDVPGAGIRRLDSPYPRETVPALPLGHVQNFSSFCFTSEIQQRTLQFLLPGLFSPSGNLATSTAWHHMEEILLSSAHRPHICPSCFYFFIFPYS